VWKFLDDEGLPYNRVYDQMFAANHNYYNTMRVSNLIHEKSFSCLTSLQELEPQTYDALTKRVKGIEVASIYAKEALMFGAKELPTAFPTWLAYRDFLLQTSPTKHKARFEKRFAAQEENEDTARQQCRQLVLNDYENSVPATQGKAKKAKADLAEWWDLL
jgi:predicted phosphoadenosine phosphosulfate sulfurtransferase